MLLHLAGIELVHSYKSGSMLISVVTMLILNLLLQQQQQHYSGKEKQFLMNALQAGSLVMSA